MKTASVSVLKWQTRTSAASSDYVEGARTTDKDQAQKAIAAKEIYKQSLQDSFSKDSYAKGLQKSGKAGWIAGVEQKGQQNYLTGVSADTARSRYATESSKYDAARNAASTMPRGVKGSPQNLNRVATVVSALRAVKVGK